MNHSRYVQDGFSSHINHALLHHSASSRARSKAGKLRANSCAGISRDLKRQGNGDVKTNQTYGNMWFFYMICKSKMYETIEIWISSLSQILTDISVEKWPIQIDTPRMLKAGGIQVVRFIISVALLRECENSGMMLHNTRGFGTQTANNRLVPKFPKNSRNSRGIVTMSLWFQICVFQITGRTMDERRNFGFRRLMVHLYCRTWCIWTPDGKSQRKPSENCQKSIRKIILNKHQLWLSLKMDIPPVMAILLK